MGQQRLSFPSQVTPGSSDAEQGGFEDVTTGEEGRTQHQPKPPGGLGKLCSWPFPDCH